MYKGVSYLNCTKQAIYLMHNYLDGDISKEDETRLRHHLEDCSDCQNHFHELTRALTLIKNNDEVEAPPDFTEKVMKQLPTEKKHVKYMRWFKVHPIVTAAAIIFIFMFSGMFSAWNQDTKLTVSKQEDLIIQGDMVIVPENVVVDDDLIVKNGSLRIDGTVEGDVTLINGKLIQADNSDLDNEELVASVGGVNGEFENVDRMLEWIWFQTKSLFKSILLLN